MANPKDAGEGESALPRTSEELKAIIKSALEEAGKAKQTASDVQEKKWTISNVLFVLLTLTLGGLIGYFFDYFKARQEEDRYSLQIAYEVGDNLIQWPKYARDKVTATYRSDVGKEVAVQSYYSMRGKILNSGNKKFQSLTLRFSSSDNLYFIKNPQFSVLPQQDRPYLEIKQNSQSFGNEDEWVFSDLSPGEHIEFQYLAFSDELFEKPPKLSIIPKEPEDKEYQVSYQDKIDLEEEKNKHFLAKPVRDFTGLDLIYIEFVAVVPIVYIVMLFSWINRRHSYFYKREWP